ncbi:MAG TPA: hypothetical protein VNF08_04460 [Acidimicrobiales bacterium]|nr:hypothetical protein [Acidimicrobiales bacterium]
MGEVFGAVLAALVLVSLFTIGMYLIVGMTVLVSTLLRARRERQMADELDQLLEQVLGPRTLEPSSTRSPSAPVRRDGNTPEVHSL